MFRFLSSYQEFRRSVGTGCGKRIPLSPSRIFVVDYLRYSSGVPSQPLMRMCDVSQVMKVRSAIPERIGWAAILIKSYAIVAERMPELRCLYRSWPSPHLYDPCRQICRMAVNRTIDGEQILKFFRMQNPQQYPLAEIQAAITAAQTGPVRVSFRNLLARMPTFVRRMVWWVALNTSGARLSSIIGTFGLTTVAALGATSVHPPTLGNIVLTSGPIDENGMMQLTIVYDHRVHDGVTIARALRELEIVMNHDVASELQTLVVSNSKAA